MTVLASATDGFYNSSGSVVARDPRGLSGTHIGQEMDFGTSLRTNRELEFGAGTGRIFPGEFLIRTNHNHAYTYPYIMMNHNFFQADISPATVVLALLRATSPLLPTLGRNTAAKPLLAF